MSATRKPAIVAQNEREHSRMHRLSPKQGRALLRRAALIRIGQWWHANGIEPSNLDDVAFVIADAAVFACGGLTIETFNHLARKMRLGIPREVADCALDYAFSKLMQCDADDQFYRMMSDAEVGRLLGLTRFERRAIEADLEQMAKRVRLPKGRRFGTTISTILGTDETPEDLKAERAERRRQRERERQKRNRRVAYWRKWKAQRRARAGSTPRAQCLTRTRPWEALGISRRTWERRRNLGSRENAANATANIQNHSRKASTAASRCNPTGAERQPDEAVGGIRHLPRHLVPARQADPAKPSHGVTQIRPHGTPKGHGKHTRNGDANSSTACIPKGSDNYRRGGQLVSEQDTRSGACAPARVPPDEARTFLEIISEGRREPPNGATRGPEPVAASKAKEAV